MPRAADTCPRAISRSHRRQATGGASRGKERVKVAVGVAGGKRLVLANEMVPSSFLRMWISRRRFERTGHVDV